MATVNGTWGPEMMFKDGVEFHRLHGGPWHEISRTCRCTWGDWRCGLPAHGPDVACELVWANTEDDIDPRLT